MQKKKRKKEKKNMKKKNRKRFQINEEEKTVKAVPAANAVEGAVPLECFAKGYHVLGAFYGLVAMNYIGRKEKRMRTDGVGVAKCHGFDMFNEEVGKNIASMKSDIKIEQDMAVEYRKTAELLKKTAEEAEKLAAKHEKKHESMLNALNEYTHR